MYFWAQDRQKTSRSKTFTYYWDHPLPGPDKGKFGAFHTSEVPYVFNSLDKANRPWGADDRAIADQMTSYWANFAATGDPNGKGLTKWPAFTGDGGLTMELGDKPGAIPVAPKAQLKLIERLFGR